MKRVVSLMCVALVAVSGCSPTKGQSKYSETEAGVSRAVEFGTVLNVREIEIQADSTKMGSLAGAGVGAGAGSYIGSGSGNGWATAGAAVVGAVAGYYGEQALGQRDGYEYVVQMQSGETKTVVQEKNEKDVVFKEGDHVMLQYCDAGDHAHRCTEQDYQRLLPIKKLPPYVKKKRKFVQTDETGPYGKKPAVKDDSAYDLFR